MWGKSGRGVGLIMEQSARHSFHPKNSTLLPVIYNVSRGSEATLQLLDDSISKILRYTAMLMTWLLTSIYATSYDTNKAPKLGRFYQPLDMRLK